MLALSFRSVAALFAGIAIVIGAASPVRADTPLDSPDNSDCAGTVRKLTVVGAGDAKGKPDRMHADLGVETEAPTVRAAVDENNDAAAKIVAALKTAGIADQDVQTQGFSVQDERPSLPGGGQGPRVFHVRNILKLTIRDLSHASAILEAAIDAGANETSGVSFAISDSSKLDAEAREQAIAAARNDAEALAKAAGVTLGPILSIRDIAAQNPSPMPFGGAMSARAAIDGPPIEPGQISSRARVEVVYSIGDANSKTAP